MKKRDCHRFSIPGTTLYYKKKSSFFKKSKYTDIYYPVINLSLGGAKFLCDERLTAGKNIKIKINVPNMEQSMEILADVRWISKNPEASYKYQTGVAFHSYGQQTDDNPMEVLSLLKQLEKKAGTG